MYKRSLLLISVIILFNLLSCTKNSGGGSFTSRSVTYKLITTNYSVFTTINYTDTLGVQTQTSAADSSLGWSKTINTEYSPFTAQLEVQGQNSTTGTLVYTLQIYVDGTLKQALKDSAAKFSSFNTETSAIVQ